MAPPTSSAVAWSKLTARQQAYVHYLRKFEGRWREAADAAGYAAKAGRTQIEEGRLFEYLELVRTEVALSQGLTDQALTAEMWSLAQQARTKGDLGNAIRAVTQVGEWKGMAAKKGGQTINVNGDGNQVIIVGARGSEETEEESQGFLDHVLAMNGIAPDEPIDAEFETVEDAPGEA
jgi:hypothetical protein